MESVVLLILLQAYLQACRNDHRTFGGDDWGIQELEAEEVHGLKQSREAASLFLHHHFQPEFAPIYMGHLNFFLQP